MTSIRVLMHVEAFARPLLNFVCIRLLGSRSSIDKLVLAQVVSTSCVGLGSNGPDSHNGQQQRVMRMFESVALGESSPVIHDEVGTESYHYDGASSGALIWTAVLT